MYLLDTNVVSELRKASTGRADIHVQAWAKSIPEDALYLSVISILEFEVGICRLERKDRRQGTVLRSWFERYVLPAFEGRILPVDLAVARRCAPLHVPDIKAELNALIAATALVHSMAVVTRNTSDFVWTGAKLLNPWEPART